MMKYFVTCCAIFVIANVAYPQNNSSLITNKVAISTSTHRWNLKEYVWSHTHPSPRENEKLPLDFQAIDNWVSLPLFDGVKISPDGQFFLYKVQNNFTQKVDSVVVQSTTNNWRFVFGKDAWSGFFSVDNKQFIFQDKQELCFVKLGTSEYHYEKEVETYKMDGQKKWLAYKLHDKDNTLVLINLVSGKEIRFNEVSTYNFDFNGFGQNSEWLICQLNNNNLLLHSLVSQKEETFENIAAYGFDPFKKWFICQVNAHSKDVILYNLNGGNKRSFSGVNSWQFSKTGDGLLLNGGMQLDYVSVKNGKNRSIWKSTDTSMMISSAGFDETGKQVVFVIKNGTERTIWYWAKGMERAEMKVSAQSFGIGKDASIQDGVRFTDNGHYIRFTWQPVVADPGNPSADAILIDVWSYQDQTLQCIQPSLYEPKSFNALVNLNTGKLVYKEDGAEELVMIKGNYAIIIKRGKKVYGDRYWERGYMDSTWLINLQNRNRKFLTAKSPSNPKGNVWFSPNGNYVVYFDEASRCNYFSMELATGKLINVSAEVPAWQLGITFHSYRTTEKPSWSSEIKIWIQENEQFLVYDNYNDIWQLDASGQRPAVCITNGQGRLQNISFELLRLAGSEREKASIGNGPFLGKDTLLLSAFNRKTKLQGFYRKILGCEGNPELLSMDSCYMERLRNGLNGVFPIKAENANIWIVNRQAATKSPNYFVTHDFKNFKQLTFLQPQEEYNWLTAELHSFKRLDGTISQGVLYKPENFDSAKKYPVLVNFYGEVSDNLYRYPNAAYIDAPHIFENPAWMVSHGYLVFIPDILFTQGQWGPSTVNTIEGAVRYLKQFSYVDSSHIGAIGHSNGGRFAYYLLTHSSSFAAMSVGAGTTNVISYALSGGLESFEMDAFGTGLGNLWDNKSSWLDQSSVLSADKVVSPLLLFHCKKDGVPYEQAIQMFTALRRLDKKVWWLQYDNGGHTLKGNDARDFTIRFTQYFDHFLKEAPAPRWMTQGVPSSLKGIENRYELDFEGTCGPNCSVCKTHSWLYNNK